MSFPPLGRSSKIVIAFASLILLISAALFSVSRFSSSDSECPPGFDIFFAFKKEIGMAQAETIVKEFDTRLSIPLYMGDAGITGAFCAKNGGEYFYGGKNTVVPALIDRIKKDSRFDSVQLRHSTPPA